MPGVLGVFRGVALWLDEIGRAGVTKASGPGGTDSSLGASGVPFSIALRFSNSSGARFTI